VRRLFRQPLRLAVGALKNWRNGTAIDYREVALGLRAARGVEVMARTQIDGATTIGGHTYVGYGCAIGRAWIGRYCSIANFVSIGPGEHWREGQVATHALFIDDAASALTRGDVTIGNDVWIGVDAVVRRGVCVGDGAIVGANSFVNEDVPPFAIVGGSPARLLRHRFSDEQRGLVERSRWWDLEPAEARARVRALEAELRKGSPAPR
jgi:acetyltransferase-like isoleucine patch superfamily enzyme